MKDSLYIVMPAYNEEENIEETVRTWYKVLDNKTEDSRLVIADYGSTDKTHEILQFMKSNGYSKLEVLQNDKKFHGPKILDLYKYAINNDIDYIFQTDSDGQTNPDEFDAFWKLRNNYDGIFGNRTIRGDGRYRAFVEKVVCLLLKIYFNVNVPDANAPFRLMKTNIVKKYIDKMPSDYNLPNIMLVVFFSYYHEKLIFKTISFRPRNAGKNSININKIIKIGWKSLGDFSKFKKEMRKKDDKKN
ncbi:glycosyltransferase family 2 protein [Eubacterium sp. MSJ-33]|uniref:glycosyltransferase family 2 protein n=1 Tax=Eubacterium sp. MSJ-33 TaxID=2841528 RepID=UPI001C744C5C|nr:glycosyltransferase family 2 protein [Eubacterium sp. MSJ-33]QWT53232.1 glycosyltransferase family 2 protein [Eubacterium sp. MSJ-33]